MPRNEVIQLRCTPAEKEKWQTAASDQNMDLSSWIRLKLDKATRPGAPPDNDQPRLIDVFPDATA